MKINIIKAIQCPFSASKIKFILNLSLVNSSHKDFFYFWDTFPYLFDIRDLKDVIKEAASPKKGDLIILQKVLVNNTSKAIFLNLSIKARCDFIQEIFKFIKQEYHVEENLNCNNY